MSYRLTGHVIEATTALAVERESSDSAFRLRADSRRGRSLVGEQALRVLTDPELPVATLRDRNAEGR